MSEDQNAQKGDGRKSYRSGTVGTEPCTMIVTGLSIEPTVNKPGRFN